MGRTCAVLQCNSNGSKKDGPPLTFHKFPKDEVLRKKWEEALNRTDWKNNKYTVICSLHFEKFCFFKTNSGLVKLMPGSVPSIIPTVEKPLIQTKPMGKFTFVGVKAESMDEEVTETEVVNPLEITKEEDNEETLYDDHAEANFINIKCEPEAMNISNVEDEVDPLEEKGIVKQEVQETVGESRLTDYVIPEEDDIDEVKQEDEVIIDDGVGVDESDEEDIKPKGYKCKYCEETFSDAQQVEAHQWNHCNDVMQTCLLCSSKFCSAQFLMKHMVESHKDTLVPTNALTCEICQKKCKSASTLKSHTLFHKVERTLECKKCATKVDWVGSLQQYNMYKNHEKTFLCRTCDQITMSQLIDLAISGNNRALKSGKTVSIDPTPSTSTSMTTYDNNRALKTGKTVSIDSTPSTSMITCDICSKTFPTSSLLLKHQLEHKIEKELLCTSCGKLIRWCGTLGQCNKYLNGEDEFNCLTCVYDKVKMCSICKTMVNRWSGVLRENLILVNNLPQMEHQFICAQCNLSTSVVSSATLQSTQMFKPILPKQPIGGVESSALTSTGSQTCENICILCNANFQSFHKLHTHKEIHKIQSYVDCSKCRKLIKWYGSLATLEDFMSGKKRIICNDCVNRNMGKFMVAHKGQYLHANVTCSNCLVSVKWVGSLLQLEKYTSNFERLLCGRCENSVKVIHIQIFRNNNAQAIQANVSCTSCQRVFLWSGRFGAYSKITAGTIESNLCPVCNMKTTQGNDKTNYNQNLTCFMCKKIFNKTNKTFEIKCRNFEGVNCVEFKLNDSVCDQCEQILKKKDKDKGNVLMCEMCRPNGKFTFTDLPSFITHIKCHIPIKDFVCTFCNKIGYWGNNSDSVNSFCCKRCTGDSKVQFSKLTKENIIFENKIVDHFKTTPMVEQALECTLCKKFYPWYGNEKQLKDLTGGGKMYVCLKCNNLKETGVKNKRLKV